MKADHVFEKTTQGFAYGFVLLVFLMGGMLLKESLPSLSKFGPSFLVTKVWDPVAEVFGALPFIYGTLVSSLLALLIAVPLSLGIAVFLSELSPNFLKKPIGFLVELLAAIPSVIYGLWGVFYLVPWMRTTAIFFNQPPYGLGLLTASLLLSIMIIPIIASISRDVLQAVPNHQREAALALGATRWEATKIGVLRYGRSGILGAIFLGLGRALGETMAVTMVIGNRPEISASLFAPAHTMASVIANEFAEASSPIYLSALAEIGLILFVITFFVNAVARWLVWKTETTFTAAQ